MALSLILGLMTWTLPGITTPAPAVADTPSDDTFVRSPNDLFAWVDAGENLDATFTKVAGEGGSTDTTVTVTAPGGASQDCVLATDAPVDSTCDFTDLTADAAGIWQIHTEPENFPGDRLTWEITVQNGNTDLPGRVWSQNYTMRNLAPVDVSVYYLNEQGFLYQANYSDYNGQDSNLVVDSVGNTLDGTCTSAYLSYDYGTPAGGFPHGDEDQYDTTRLRDAGTCGDVYKIFFAEPAADLPTSGELPDGTTTWIRPELVLPDITSVDFDETGTDERSGTFTVNVDNFTGQATVEVDVDGNGEYGDPIDRQLPVSVVDGVGVVEFDGLDGNGETITTSTDLSARAFIDRVGEIHFVNWDVEQRGGLEVTALNGPESGALTLYWDDTALRTADRECTTPQIDGTAGVNSAGGIHGWECDTSANDGIGGSWGDFRYIDDWTYQTIDEQLEVDLPGRQLAIEKTTDATDATRIGDTVSYTVTITNTGGAAYTEDDPASFIDDLSGVLDDAEYNDDAEVSAGAVSYDAPRLSWAGALEPDASVTLSYSVTLNGAGDTEVDNVAFVTDCTDCDPPTPPADACADTGTDPETGLPCVPVEFDLPKLSVEKSADQTELPTVGDTVTYTVTATNTGAGDYSAENPATVLDDVTDVLDDATIDEASISASSGTATFAEPILTWNGPLAAAETVTITYQVTYTGAGDSRLVNVAWAPNDPENKTPECNPADENGLDPETGEPCGRIVIPAADLDVQKSVDPQDGSTVQAGQELTYTITFANLGGTTAADVDGWSDDLSRVLDDAEMIAEPTASDDNLTVAQVADGAFTVDGSVPAGESYTVTYTVKVLPDGERGDQVLDNFVVPPGEDPPGSGDPCADGDPLCTTNPVPEIEIDKTVDPESGTAVESGQVLTYTLSFTNTGKAAGDVDKVDDLSHLLDDAEVTQAPVSSDEALMVSEIENEQFAITGSLAPGQTVTVTYQATVNAAENLGDADLANFVINPGDNPPGDPECADELKPCTENPAPKIIDAKSVDPEDGTTVQSGETLTYTLTFTNEGKAPGQLDKVDDLTHVLDDADVVSDPVASDEALTVSDITEGRYAITGTLAPGQTVTVSYEVTVRAQDELGDTQLANFLMNPDDPTPEDAQDCEADDPDCTYNPVPKIIDSKTVDPESGSSVKAGQDLTYTLTFTNEGQGSGTLNRVDDLTHILDDAKITKDPTVSDEALSVADIDDDHRLAITGTLKPGQTATVSYTVTVNEAADLGDSELANFLLDPEDPTPDEPVCDGDDCTYNPVSNITVDKAADPESGETVEGGQTVGYVLTFHNSGKADGAVDYTDHLGGVLDDADLVGDVTSSDPALSAARDGQQVAISGTLAGGQTVKITYQVKVKAYADQGDHLLGNFVTVTGQEPPTDCVEDSNLCTEHPTKDAPADPEQPGNPGNPGKPGGASDTSPSGGLAQTGAAAVLVPAALIGLLLTGASAWLLTRRRQAGIANWGRKS